MRATRKDVALKAGVSEASVSYVLNKSRKVSDLTIKKVMDAVKELNYSVDMVARSMVKNETMQLAIVANDLSNPHFSEIFNEFENSAIDRGYLVNIFTGQREIEKYFQSLISRRIDGVFIMGMPYMPYETYDRIIKNLVANKVKVLISGNILNNCEGVSHIEPIYSIGINEAISYLKMLNHKHIAMINAFERGNHFDKRDDMFFNAMKKHLPESEIIYMGESNTCIPDTNEGYKLMKKLLLKNSDVTAVLCTNDMMAYGAIHAANDMNKSVPKDISVIGFDDIKFSSMFRPSLTTIGFPKKKYGKLAFDTLYKLIKKNETDYVKMKTELIIRNSTAKLV